MQLSLLRTLVAHAYTIPVDHDPQQTISKAAHQVTCNLLVTFDQASQVRGFKSTTGIGATKVGPYLLEVNFRFPDLRLKVKLPSEQ